MITLERGEARINDNAVLWRDPKANTRYMNPGDHSVPIFDYQSEDLAAEVAAANEAVAELTADKSALRLEVDAVKADPLSTIASEIRDLVESHADQRLEFAQRAVRLCQHRAELMPLVAADLEVMTKRLESERAAAHEATIARLASAGVTGDSMPSVAFNRLVDGQEDYQPAKDAAFRVKLQATTARAYVKAAANSVKYAEQRLQQTLETMLNARLEQLAA